MDAFKSHVVYRFQGFELDVRNRRLSNASGHIKLGSRAFDTLVELVHHRGEILSKDYLMGSVWLDVVVEENNVSQAVCLVRKALGDSTEEPKFVKTVAGKGFCFVADTEVHVTVDQLHEPLVAGPGETPANIESASYREPVTDASWRLSVTSGTAGFAIILLLLLYLFPDQVATTATGNNASTQPAANASAAYTENPSIIPGSIAVMPFANLGDDSSGDLFVRGLHDELISQLARIKSLKVISRDSVVSLSKNGGSVFAIADFLNVESLITGSILVVNEQARINLQMLNADTGVAIWGESFEVDTQNLAEMIAAQGEIALNVVKAMKIEIRPPESARLATLPTQSFEAYRYYLTARNAYSHQNEEEKWLLVSNALALDPEYADAHLFFASVNSALATSPMPGFTHEAHLQLMLESVDAYIQLEPERTEGYALKSVALGALRDWQGAGEQLEILQQMRASDAEMKYVAALLMGLGDFRGAIDIYQESLVTEPANLYARALLMASYEMAGKREQARDEYALGNELKAVWWGDTVNVLLAMGRKEPIDSTDDLTDLSPELIRVLNNLQDSEMANQEVKRYMASGVTNAREDVLHSALAAYHGHEELASTLLRMAMEKVSTYVFWAWLPVFDEVRRTEEFRELLVDFGLVDYWRQHGWPEVCQPYNDTFSCEWVSYPE